MSLENVEKFYAKLGEDRALLEKVTKAAEGLKDKFKTKEEQEDKGIAETFLVLEPFVRELNCPFTQYELQDYVNNKARCLSDRQLDAIAGGNTCACVVAGGGQNYDGATAEHAGCAGFGMGRFSPTPHSYILLLCCVIGGPMPETV